MAAAIVGILAGCTLEAMRKAVAEFKAIGHRMEIAGTVNNVTFINDSKATNPGAVLRAIEELSNVILLMGGRDKDNDFTILKSMIRQNVKRLIIFGEAREKINSVLGNEAETTIATGLNDAVATAYKSALPGDIVLLSPGCASFDEFKDYADRGNRFKEIVERLELTSL
jgi:UDP-N-acetylmuramoylalanine--D-glutamate ligase